MGVKYNVNIQQNGSFGRFSLSIRGRKCQEASQELAIIVTEIMAYTLPEDWELPITQYIKKVVF